jgi:diadenosine tetraphosphatase ApaH/serine/threonine PP2A family protein phosphatase
MAGRVFAVGDIHGCAAELGVLLDGLDLGAGDSVVCVGDYVDRGPDSRAVIDMLLALRAREDLTTVFLRGNHEDMCLDFLGRPGRHGEAWRVNGGITTLQSYDIDPYVSGPVAAACLPETHLAFLEELVPWHTALGHLMVHAGIRPGCPFAEQTEEDLYWIRDEFIHRSHGLPYTVVFGHTPQRQVFVDLPYKIGIDTGCVYGGMLTALELGDHTLHQVRRGERRVRSSELPRGGRRAAYRP